MPKAKHGTLNKLKDAIIGGKEQEPKQTVVVVPSDTPAQTARKLIEAEKEKEERKKRKYTKKSSRWTTQKDVNDAVLKDIASSCCNNNTNTDLLDIPVQTQSVQIPPPAVIEEKAGKKRAYRKRQESVTAVVTDSSKFKKINAWKSPWEKLYVMMTLRDLDRMRLAFIQKKLKTINSAQVLRDALKLYYETIKRQEKDKKIITKN